jgi:hypothetical protein
MHAMHTNVQSGRHYAERLTRVRLQKSWKHFITTQRLSMCSDGSRFTVATDVRFFATFCFFAMRSIDALNSGNSLLSKLLRAVKK